MALPDGAHQNDEEFSYFSLVHKGHAGSPRRCSVFGISCMHQMDSSALRFRPPEVTRSAVQKAVVVVTDRPQGFSALREKLSAVTRAWFAQRDFRDVDILQVGCCLFLFGFGGWVEPGFPFCFFLFAFSLSLSLSLRRKGGWRGDGGELVSSRLVSSLISRLSSLVSRVCVS
jgi:hypothetical protein